MANPFEVRVPNIYEALMAGDQGYKGMRGAMNERQQTQARKEAEAALMGGGDTRGALARLIGAGDYQGANSVARFGQDERNFGFRQQESQRQQANQDRQFGLQSQTANTAQIQQIENPDGTKTLVRIARDGTATPINVPGQQTTQPNNPYAVGGKLNEGQGKAATYGDRMAKSHEIISGLEDINDFNNWEKGGYIGGQLEKVVPSGVYNTFAGADRQKFMQAKRDFVNAVLRRESGAVISDQEFANADKQYFPQPGDGPDVIKQKRDNRITSMQGIMREAGPGYKAPAIAGSSPAQGQRPAQQQQFRDGMTATGPGGQKIIFRGGQWVPVQ
jgi:hypothetical protein